MEECFKCGISSDQALLFGAVSGEGIVRICRKCSFDEDVPIIKHMREESERKPSVHERLSRLAGIEELKREEPKQDEGLKMVAEDNFRKQVFEENPAGMIHNFHWIIMRARRARKLTQKQLADELCVPEEAIRKAEQGFLPKNDFSLINKIENNLGIRLTEGFEIQSFDEEVEKVKESFSQGVEEDKIKFDDVTSRTLTIADLQEMKKKQEEEIFEKPVDEKPEKSEDISNEDIDKILFGK